MNLKPQGKSSNIEDRRPKNSTRKSYDSAVDTRAAESSGWFSNLRTDRPGYNSDQIRKNVSDAFNTMETNAAKDRLGKRRRSQYAQPEWVDNDVGAKLRGSANQYAKGVEMRQRRRVQSPMARSFKKMMQDIQSGKVPMPQSQPGGPDSWIDGPDIPDILKY